MEIWVKIRNTITGWKYRWFLKPILFHFDPEDIHDLFVKVGKFLGYWQVTRWVTKICFNYQNPKLEQEVLGLKFKNPIGLAAGFDKNAELTRIIPSVGFGFTEIGSVTGRPCVGNPKPRLWRLPKSRSLIVYYGLKNDGAEEIVRRLKNSRGETSVSSRTHLGNLRSFPIGVSIAKTNDDKTTTTEAGIADYLFAYKTFVEAGVGGYYTINISCPNTFGGEPFVEKEKLDKLLSALHQLYRPKPIFIKLPPDLKPEQLNDIIELAKKYNISGFVCSNLTKDRDNNSIKNKIIEKNLPTNVGGLSGK
ncbi:MAG TPA: quinone-dependent dihydroorotate dehydrogenase, partial [Candidatus Paceibacterota bacterium]|nr:quinone-dependent dihydroorotate dehydrogenase [Candidatus Paceibacterota bacterium]